MAVDNQKANKEIIVKPGETVIIQGHQYNSLNILHSGTLEMLYTDKDVSGKSEAEILSNSMKVYQISGEFSFSEYGLIHEIPEFQTIRALEEAKISVYPFSKDQLLAIPQTNPSLALYIMRSIVRKINLLIEKTKLINQTYHDIMIFADNLKMISGEMVTKMNPQDINPGFKDLALAARSISLLFGKSGGKLPGQIDISFLSVDYGSTTGKNYKDQLIDVSSIIDQDLMSFFYNFLKIDTPVLSNHLSTLPGLFKFPVESLSIIQNSLFQTVYEYNGFIDKALMDIYGEGKSILSMWLTMGKQLSASASMFSPQFNGQLLGRLQEFQKIHNSILVAQKPNVMGKISVFLSQLSQMSQVSQSGASAPVFSTASQATEYKEQRVKVGQLKDTLQQLIKFSGILPLDTENFLKIIKSFKALPNKLDAGQDARRIRLQVTRMFWTLYYNCFMKSVNVGQLPLAVDMFFKFGLIDETLVNEQTLLSLLNFEDSYTGKFEVYSTYEWLKKIQVEEKIPSITEMGLSFEKYLQEEAKSKTYTEMQEMTNTPEKLTQLKVQFEVNQMLTSCGRVCSESLATALPALIQESIPMDINKTFLYKQQIDDIIKELRSIDFSLFSREVILKTKIRIEIIEKDILPDIIILPIVGGRVMMWQDLESNNKRTKSRFIVPQFFNGDLRRSLILACARFRWEICKTQKGPQWADPVEGGLTGFYFDYISFYKKNPNLSEEAKEKITEHIKNFRSNRERFAQDYLSYVEFESKGIAKLNKVLRDIFYRSLPFAKVVRDKLKNLPVYEELENRYNNVMNRKLKDLEVKFRKYEKEAEGMPEEITEYMEMYKK